MLSYWLNYRKNTESKKPNIQKIKYGRINCAICGSKKSNFIKEQKSRGLLSKFERIKVLILNDLPIANTLF